MGGTDGRDGRTDERMDERTERQTDKAASICSLIGIYKQIYQMLKFEAPIYNIF